MYFKYIEGLKNDSNQDLSIDIRTDGGLIVTPGSLRKIGDEIREYTVYKDNVINDMPKTLFDKLTEYFGVNKTKVNKLKHLIKSLVDLQRIKNIIQLLMKVVEIMHLLNT